MFKIALDAGHGMNTPGKRCLKSIDKNETREWFLNNRICKYIEQKLASYDGFMLMRMDDTTGVTDVPLVTRTNKANQWGADFYLSVHANAGVNGGSGGGIVSIVYTKASETSNKYSKILYDEMIKTTGLKGNRSTPLAKQNLHVCRETNMPAVLVECGFMDSITDVPIIITDKFANDIAEGMVNALVKIGNLKIKNKTENNEDLPITQKEEIPELTTANDIVWELGHRGLVTDTQGMLKEMNENPNGRLYWLARKMLNYIRQKGI